MDNRILDSFYKLTSTITVSVCDSKPIDHEVYRVIKCELYFFLKACIKWDLSFQAVRLVRLKGFYDQF